MIFNGRVNIRLVGAYHACMGCDELCPMMYSPFPGGMIDLDLAIRLAANRHYNSLTEDSTPDLMCQCVLRQDRTRVVTFVLNRGVGMRDHHVVHLIHQERPHIGPSKMMGLCPTLADGEAVARSISKLRLEMPFSVVLCRPDGSIISNLLYDTRNVK